MRKVVLLIVILKLTVNGLVSADAPALTLKRIGKTLTNTFPFNLPEEDNHHHHHDDEHSHDDNDDAEKREEDRVRPVHLPEPNSRFRQGIVPARLRSSKEESREGEVEPLNLNLVAAAGKRCVEKVVMVEELQYDDAIECHHSYDKRCHTTYTTSYVPQQKKECDENFKKDCFIEYKVRAFNETIQVCQEKMTRNCDEPGPTVCETMYESECETRYHEHEVEEDVPECQTMQVEKCRDVTQGYTTKNECDKWPKQVCSVVKKTVKRYSPETQCHQVPREICGPGPCPIVSGPEECREEVKTIIQEIPDETCSLNPQKVCKFVTVLVPKLKPRENCIDVPKEICTRRKRNPRKVKRPVIKKWCYTPKEEEEDSKVSANENSSAKLTADES